MKIGRAARLISGVGFPHEYQGKDSGAVPFLKVSDLTSGNFRQPVRTAQNWVSHAELSSLGARLAPAGAIAFPKVGAAMLKNPRRILGHPAAMDNNLMAAVPLTGEPRFWLYALSTIDLGEIAAGGVLPYVNEGQVRDLRIPFPSADEQRRIADYLDAEIDSINSLVIKKHHLIILLNERIDSRVLHHVGASRLVHPERGNATLPIRRVLDKVLRPPVAGAGIITAYRDGQVTDRNARRADGYTLSASTQPQGQHVQVGDVVVHGLDGFAGAIGTAEAEGNCSPVYHVCVPKNLGDSHFLGRLLRVLSLQGYLGNFATSTRERAVDFRNWDLFGRIPIPVVPPVEQREIGEWISKVRPLQEAIEKSAVLAAERRQALITAAVTGQFDVSTASGRNVIEGVTV
jgi:type I restriction enzyme S subunit